jgi:hypothetical protein
MSFESDARIRRKIRDPMRDNGTKFLFSVAPDSNRARDRDMDVREDND